MAGPLKHHPVNQTANTPSMPTTFLDLPGELHNKIYRYVLLQEDSIRPFWPRYDRGLGLSILRTNQKIYKEAKAIFYAQNSFDFTLYSPSMVSRFFDLIGGEGTSYLQHVRMDFPAFRRLDQLPDGSGSPENNSLQILSILQRNCPQLKTIETSLHRDYDLTSSFMVVVAMLDKTAAQFRTLPSLQKVVVEVFEDEIDEALRQQMERYGWSVKVVNNEEVTGEWDDDRSCWGDYEDDDRSLDEDVDDYDIDNDSDFWRRAAD
ncbi:hypothetical protein P168DRAFT_314253 [Aspergillus campestris IBT 28561]|uniref:Uncharacterized protein n=1 Tax=Aspergillus campestris (strain IBT 28561) TaxID=1392248 RepID=A0A2I1DE23_ASPC2|nr:uncharacterized protein P168DRAFT_314253 [Aspergillus campestris IBT 28561]PKY08128.1 hypothetical protein P168DRAFT_314253 [Aspergillus campestris IBT 28561]